MVLNKSHRVPNVSHMVLKSHIGDSHNKSHMVLNVQSGALKGISQTPYPNACRYHGLLCCKSQSTLGPFDGWVQPVRPAAGQ